MKLIRILFIVFYSISLTSCEKKSTNAEDVYELWVGIKAPYNIKPVNGQYWESSKLALNYTMFLELNVTKEWSDNFIKRKIEVDFDSVKLPNEKPSWFTPSSNSKVYVSKKSNPGSYYFIDSDKNSALIYEIQ